MDTEERAASVAHVIICNLAGSFVGLLLVGVLSNIGIDFTAWLESPFFFLTAGVVAAFWIGPPD